MVFVAAWEQSLELTREEVTQPLGLTCFNSLSSYFLKTSTTTGKICVANALISREELVEQF